MKIVIIDDDQLVCMSLKMILEAEEGVQVVAVGNDGSQARLLYREHQPDVLLMDIRMKEISGIEALESVLQEFPNAKVLLLTTFVDDAYIVKSLELGAKGYILKQNYENIVPALKAVHTGQNVYGTEVVGKLPQLMKSKCEFDYGAYEISPKEYELISLVAEGLSNREIAQALYLSEGTVRNYLSIILEKLNLRDRTQLAVFYYQHK